jgi:hypothetical protein
MLFLKMNEDKEKVAYNRKCTPAGDENIWTSPAKNMDDLITRYDEYRASRPKILESRSTETAERTKQTKRA